MIISIVLLVVSAVLIVWGADKLTDGASAIALRLGMSELVVGLTVVSFGTSLPEFIVSFFGSISGSSDICVGNIVGSNLFNTLVIVGLSAIVCPIAVTRGTVHKDIPFVLMASVLLALLTFDAGLNMAERNMLSVADGLVMLLFFCIFMAYTFSIVRDTDGDAAESSATEVRLIPAILRCIIGLVCLVVGGDLFVSNATDIAHALNISEMVVGLTIAAGGTSLPELATSVVAARKGQSAMAIGNVIGSNVFNILFVLGLCCTVSPIPADSLGCIDMAMLVGSGLLFLVFSRSRYRISRGEGCILLMSYVVYICAKIWI